MSSWYNCCFTVMTSESFLLTLPNHRTVTWVSGRHVFLWMLTRHGLCCTATREGLAAGLLWNLCCLTNTVCFFNIESVTHTLVNSYHLEKYLICIALDDNRLPRLMKQKKWQKCTLTLHFPNSCAEVDSLWKCVSSSPALVNKWHYVIVWVPGAEDGLLGPFSFVRKWKY